MNKRILTYTKSILRKKEKRVKVGLDFSKKKKEKKKARLVE